MPAPRKVTIKDELRAVELYKTMSLTQVAQEMGWHRSTILKMLVRQGVKRRPKSSTSASFRKPFDRLNWFTIYYHMYWELGLTQAEIARRLGQRESMVQDRMNFLGIATRPRRERIRRRVA